MASSCWMAGSSGLPWGLPRMRALCRRKTSLGEVWRLSRLKQEEFGGIKVFVQGSQRARAPLQHPAFSLCQVSAMWRELFLMQSFHFSPDDHSRVHLTPVEGVPDSDYINASFINVSFGVQRGNPHRLRPGRWCLVPPGAWGLYEL